MTLATGIDLSWNSQIMKTTHRTGFLLLAVSSLLFCQFGFAQQEKHKQRKDVATALSERSRIVGIVDSVGKAEMKTGKLVGLSLGVADREKVISVQGFGLASIEHNIPVTDKTVFRIGSITKNFTAAAILALVEEKKLELDDPLTRFLSDYPLPAGNSTIQQLLHHTSGIKDLTRLPTFRRERQVAATPEEVRARFKDLPLNFKQNEKHQYCNSGYLLLAMVIEEVTQKKYAEFVQERLFKPIGLTATYCDDQFRIIPNQASGYSRWTGEVRYAPHVNVKSSTGSGNIATSTPDLLKWQQSLIAHKVIGKKYFDLMKTKGTLNNSAEFGYGMGYFIRKLGAHDVIRHGGAISGFRAELVWLPESDYIIVVQANTHGADVRRIADKIAQRILSKPNR